MGRLNLRYWSPRGGWKFQNRCFELQFKELENDVHYTANPQSSPDLCGGGKKGGWLAGLGSLGDIEADIMLICGSRFVGTVWGVNVLEPIGGQCVGTVWGAICGGCNGRRACLLERMPK